MAKILIVEDESVLVMKSRIDLEETGHEVAGIADNASQPLSPTGS